MAVSPYALVVHPSVPAHNLKEFIAYAKANPGKLSYGSAGVGSASHLAAELLKSMAGIEMVHVPNKGMNPALIDLMGGQVQVLFASVPGMLSEKSERAAADRDGGKQALGADAGSADHGRVRDCQASRSAIGPDCSDRRALDPAIVKKLHDEIIAILASAEVKARIKTLGYDLIASTPEEFGAAGEARRRALDARW